MEKVYVRLVICSFLALCGIWQAAPAAAFDVSLRTPSSGSCYNPTEYVDVEAYASSTDAPVSQVSLYLDGSPYGTLAVSPYMWRLTGLSSGSHTLYVTAADEAGRTAASETYTIRVGTPPLVVTRDFGAAPAAGVHPRVLFDDSYVNGASSPLYAFWHNTAFGAYMRDKKINSWINDTQMQTLANLDLSGGITQTLIDTYVTSDEMRNVKFYVNAADARVHNSATVRTTTINALYNYARLVIESKTTLPTNTGVRLWSSTSWDMSRNWVFGDGMAMAYDMLYNYMTTVQQDKIREAIALVTAGKRSWGMGYPATRIVSNWSLYNSSLFTMACAIEGETGVDPDIQPLYYQLAEDYFTHGFYECGGAGEDGYSQLALREGGLAMIAMARRGHNFFENPHVQAATRYFAQINDPSPYAELIGHSAGGGYSYPGMQTSLKYAYPNDPVVDWSYQRCITHEKNTLPNDYFTRAQTYHIQSIFGSEVTGVPASPFSGLSSNTNLTVFYPRRGLLVARSDWTNNSLYVHYDARSDAYYMGHDNVDRGTFTISALGRSFVPDRNGWNEYVYSEDHALMYIDGASEPFKAPSVRYVHQGTNGNVTVGAANLKYAYDYWWSPAWPTSSTTYPSPAEHEENGPRAVGWPGNEDWLPTTLYNLPDFSFPGSYMWRKPHIGLEKYFRTIALVRGTSPYALIIEDIKKDSSSHLYESYIPIESDISLVSFTGNDIVVGDAAGKRLLFRVLQSASPIAAHVEDYVNSVTDTAHPSGHSGRRLVIGCTAVEPNLKIMVWPHMSGATMPTTSLSNGRFDFSLASQKERIIFVPGSDGRTYIRSGCTAMPASGDMNGDANVDMLDLALLAASWQDCYNCDDLGTLTANWLISAP